MLKNECKKEKQIFEHHKELLELVDQTRRAPDAAIPELYVNVNGPPSADLAFEKRKWMLKIKCKSFERRPGLLDLVGRTRRATDATIPKLSVE